MSEVLSGVFEIFEDWDRGKARGFVAVLLYCRYILV